MSLTSPLLRLPDDLTPLLLPLILPPTPPLPPHLLSPLFRHRLLYLPPLLTEMDRQLSPFPMPITSYALQQRLESLAGAYAVGPVKYAWDGESGLARRCVHKEGQIEGNGDDDVEMHFMRDAEEGWGFHGLRLPGQADEMGLKWVLDPSELEIDTEASTSTGSGSSYDLPPGEGTGSLDPYAYTASGEQGDDAEVKDYWAGFSPPQSPTLGPGGATTGTAIDEDEREREYWAQYSNGPSKAASPVVSRRPSGLTGAGGAKHNEMDMSRLLGGDEAGRIDAPNHRGRSGTIIPSQSHPPSGSTSPLPQPPNNAISLNTVLPSPTLNPTEPSRRASPPPASAEITLLRDRLRMKTLSLLQREWASFVAGANGQDELEEKGMRWLALGRESNFGPAATASSANGSDGEEKLRHTMEVLREMHGVYQSTPSAGEPGEDGEGFYRLVEQALRFGEGTAAGSGAAGSGEAGCIPRTYSFDQATYWE